MSASPSTAPALQRSPSSSMPACPVHPDEAAADVCPRCGRFSCVECLERGPGGTYVCRECLGRRGVAAGVAWERRVELGLPHAWWRTAIDVIRAPTATFRASGEERSIRGSLLFAMLSYFVGLCTMMPVAVLGARAQVEGRPEYEVALGLFSPWTLAALGMAAYVLFQLAHPFFDHLALRLVGARPRPLAVTIRAWALAQGPFLLGAIPLCGWYVAPAWTVVTRVLAYRELHGTTSLRAFIAYLLGAILLAVTVTLALGLVVLMAGWSARNLG